MMKDFIRMVITARMMNDLLSTSCFANDLLFYNDVMMPCV